MTTPKDSYAKPLRTWTVSELFDEVQRLRAENAELTRILRELEPVVAYAMTKSQEDRFEDWWNDVWGNAAPPLSRETKGIAWAAWLAGQGLIPT